MIVHNVGRFAVRGSRAGELAWLGSKFQQLANKLSQNATAIAFLQLLQCNEFWILETEFPVQIGIEFLPHGNAIRHTIPNHVNGSVNPL